MISCGLSDCKDIWLCIVSMYILYLAKCPIFGGLPLLPFRKVTQQLHFSPDPVLGGLGHPATRGWKRKNLRFTGNDGCSVIREVVCEGQGWLPLRRLAMKILNEYVEYLIEYPQNAKTYQASNFQHILWIEVLIVIDSNLENLKLRILQRQKPLGVLWITPPGPAERRCLGEGIGY